MELNKRRLQLLAGIKQVLKEELGGALDTPTSQPPMPGGTGEPLGGGSSIHILNDQNASIQSKDIKGFPYKYLQLSLTQDLSEQDIDTLCTELKAFKDKLGTMNTPPSEHHT